MTDIQLRTFLRAQLLALLPTFGVTGVPVIAAYQPTTEGRQGGKALYIHSLGEVQEGFQQRAYLEQPAGTLRRAEMQVLATTMQISAYAPENDALTPPLATDIARAASMALQSRAFIEALTKEQQGAGVRRITAIRRPYVTNDYDQFEIAPNFDITIVHAIGISSEVAKIDRAEYGLHRVI